MPPPITSEIVVGCGTFETDESYYIARLVETHPALEAKLPEDVARAIAR